MSVRIIPALVVAAVMASVSAAFAQTPARAGQSESAPAREVATASDLAIWKTVTLGRYRGVDAVRNALDDARIVTGDSADEILGRPAFAFAGTPRELNLVVRSVADLGFGVAGATLTDVYVRALRLGFELCPEEVGPQLRLQYLNQPVGEFLHVAMKPQRNYDGDMIDFTLANSGAGLTLLGGSARPDLVVATNVHFVFVRPSAQQVSR
jgi:hypothetical protein